jgi:peroxiredoxin Q/BCP
MKIRTIFTVGISLMIFLSGCADTAGTPVDKISSPTDKPSHRNSSLEIAPDFTLLDGAGNMIHLSDELQKNEQVVLVFYYTHVCSPCMRQLGDIQRDYAKYEEKGALVIAIAVQSGGSANYSVQASGAEFPILADSDHVVSEAYGVFDTLPEDDGLATPSVFVIDSDNRIVWSQIATSIYEEGEGPGSPSCGGKRVPSETILENLLG